VSRHATVHAEGGHWPEDDESYEKADLAVSFDGETFDIALLGGRNLAAVPLTAIAHVLAEALDAT
jgi:hypothetical protein